MMGHQGGVQDKLFYASHLDDHVPQSHLLRGIDRFFDLPDLRHHLRAFLWPHRSALDRVDDAACSSSATVVEVSSRSRYGRLRLR